MGPDATGFVLDPFAGVGRVHNLRRQYSGLRTVGIEIEAPWADMHPSTLCANSLDIPFRSETFDVMITSPTYGNRFSDHHNAQDGSKRTSYTHNLRAFLDDPEYKLNLENTGYYAWGNTYRALHRRLWKEIMRVMKPGAIIMLNVSDIIQKFEVQQVVRWHRSILRMNGVEWGPGSEYSIQTPRMRQGENWNLRVSNEKLLVGVKK
jgi:tRNA G10  N-methylase Trm11